jgi:hypothetical protein
MGTKHRLSKDQRRKDKLARRTKRQENAPTPYSGKKYRDGHWTRHVYATELAVYETIQASGRRLTNEQAREAFVTLIKALRSGAPAELGDDEPDLEYLAGQEVPYLIWNIRAHWTDFVLDHGPVATEDWIGILRTLLYSIESHGWHTGSGRGYLAFLEGFIGEMQQSQRGKFNPLRQMNLWID